MEDGKKLNFNLPANIAPGTYVNGTVICHSRSEFILDFIRQTPGMSQPEIVSRIVMAPDTARQLIASLNESYGKWVETHGRRMAAELAAEGAGGGNSEGEEGGAAPQSGNAFPFGFAGGGKA